MKEESKCLNCGESVAANYCSVCGQKRSLSSITIKDIGKDFLNSFTNYEGPFPRTVAYLFYQPGLLVREYLSGKRKKYYTPLRYLLISLAISVLVVKLCDYDPVLAQVKANNNELGGGGDRQERLKEAGRLLHQNINYFIFLFPFSIAVITKLFYWRKPFYFTERLVLGFYLSSQFLLFNSIFIPVITYYPRAFHLNTYIILAYLSFAFFNFFKPKIKLLGVFQAFLAAVFSFLIYVLFAFTIALGIVVFSQ